MGSLQPAEEIDYANAEHICLEGDQANSNAESDSESGAICFDQTVRRAGHREWVRLTLFDQGLLRVRRGSKRKILSDYTIDVRFVDPNAFFARHIAWRWLAAGFGCISLGVIGLWATLSWAGAWWWAASLSALAISAGGLCCLIALYRTGDRLRYASVHGRAEVIRISGGLGLPRRLNGFSAALKACIAAARNSMDIKNAGFLRDEMREHQRLKIEGILADDDFEQAKIRILGAHG